MTFTISSIIANIHKLPPIATLRYKSAVQEDADWLVAGLEYVNGGTHLLEKLFRGDWDEQFLVLQPGETVRREDVLV